ncbi:MAG: thioredoxin domain-containing protein [Betaproteobacteria bacterium]|nr:thioredoxin domain-containing protein [Betaproteobacteria bacterium]
MNKKTLFIVVVAVLLVIFAAGTTFYYAMGGDPAPKVAAIDRTALIRVHSPTIGKAEAPVVVVEFIDPACETCAIFYSRVKEIMAANPDRIRLVLRYAPFHTGSDKVVAVLEAARKQGKFWPALEALLASQAVWSPNHMPQVSLVWKQLEGLGLDLEKVRVDMAAPEIARVIAQDLDDARKLNVTMTPEYFVNGKPLPSFGFDELKTLIDEALAETKRR